MLAYAGRGSLALRQLNCSVLVAEMTETLREIAGANVSLACDFASDLPPVEGDASLLRQVVSNFVINASEAIGSGQGTITLRTGRIGEQTIRQAHRSTLQRSLVGAHLFIEVTDTGVGIDDTTFPRLFEPFFSTKFAGRGLGLAAAMGIARQHRGGIEVVSEPGAGATFRLLLPALDSF